MRNRVLVPLCALLAVGCGGASPSAPRTPPSTTPPAAVTTGRLVSALAQESGVPGGSVSGVGLSASTSDTQGFFRVEAEQGGTFTVTIAAASWIERRTLFKVPGNHAEVSLIPASINQAYFNQMCRGWGGRLTRWTRAPALLVESAVLQYPGRTALDERVPEATLDSAAAKVRGWLVLLSAGNFSDFSSVERRTTPAGEASTIPPATIALTFQRSLLEKWGHVAYGARATGAAPYSIGSGEVALDVDWYVRGLPAGSRRDFDNVVQHELGHALGYSHTSVSPSFMYEVYLMTVSAPDRDAFKIFFQRPPGNQSPDVDPDGASLNLHTGAGVWDRPDCAFLKVGR